MNRSTSGNGPHGLGRHGVRPRTIVLGTDADGCDHLYKTESESVHVIDAGERVWREDLTTDVDDWVDHITARRDWATKRYGSIFEKLTAAFTDQREGAY